MHYTPGFKFYAYAYISLEQHRFCEQRQHTVWCEREGGCTHTHTRGITTAYYKLSTILEVHIIM